MPSLLTVNGPLPVVPAYTLSPENVATTVYRAPGGAFNADGCSIKRAGLMDAVPVALVVAVHVSTTRLLGFLSWNVIGSLAIGVPPMASVSLSVSVAVMLAGSL